MTTCDEFNAKPQGKIKEILVNMDDVKQIKNAEKLKAKYENDGLTLLESDFIVGSIFRFRYGMNQETEQLQRKLAALPLIPLKCVCKHTIDLGPEHPCELEECKLMDMEKSIQFVAPKKIEVNRDHDGKDEIERVRNTLDKMGYILVEVRDDIGRDIAFKAYRKDSALSVVYGRTLRDTNCQNFNEGETMTQTAEDLFILATLEDALRALRVLEGIETKILSRAKVPVVDELYTIFDGFQKLHDSVVEDEK